MGRTEEFLRVFELRDAGAGEAAAGAGHRRHASINLKAVTPAFMSALLGTAIGCVVVTVWAIAEWHDSFGPYLLAAGGLYLLGTLGLTIAYHVPRNNQLAALRPDSAEAAHLWTRYLSEWTAFNHLRAAAALAASVSLTLVAVVD